MLREDAFSISQINAVLRKNERRKREAEVFRV